VPPARFVPDAERLVAPDAFFAVDFAVPDAFFAVDFAVPDAFFAVDFVAPDAFFAVDFAVPDAFFAVDFAVPDAFFAVDFVAPDDADFFAVRVVVAMPRRMPRSRRRQTAPTVRVRARGRMVR
jgi:hypothetical protein